ncbi:MAG: hypothetical protein U5L03_16555 [Burkholderiaceae bacterium]|nr:hypothetical protein [Burkholderiaceae bacterium]
MKLDKWPTKIEPFYASGEEYKQLLAAGTSELSDLQPCSMRMTAIPCC